MSRLSGKPFQILSVCVDDDRGALVEFLERIKFPGIHTWEEQGSANPVAQLYNVQALPTSYLIDHNGVIRARDIDPAQLVATVERILKKTQQ